LRIFFSYQFDHAIYTIMGPDINGILFPIVARRRGAGFGSALMIGRRDLNAHPGNGRALRPVRQS